MVTCGKCASAAMPANELAEHERQYHPETFLPPIAPRTFKIQPPDYHTAGSYKAPFLGKEQHSDSDSTASSDSSNGSKRPTRRSKHKVCKRTPRRSPSSSSHSSGSSRGSPQSSPLRQQQGNQDLLKLFMQTQQQMAAIQAESHFKVEEVCSKFDPSKFNSTTIFGGYQNFRMELMDLEEAMIRFGYTQTRMYKTLKTRLEGAARDLIRGRSHST